MFDFPSAPANGQVFDPVTGPAYSFDSTSGVWKAAIPQTKKIINIQELFLDVSGTWVKSPTLKFLQVSIVGGGAGATGCNATGAGQSSVGGSGGGGGFVSKIYTAAELPASVAYTVGAGGAFPRGRPGAQPHRDPRHHRAHGA